MQTFYHVQIRINLQNRIQIGIMLETGLGFRTLCPEASRFFWILNYGKNLIFKLKIKQKDEMKEEYFFCLNLKVKQCITTNAFSNSNRMLFHSNVFLNQYLRLSLHPQWLATLSNGTYNQYS